MDLQHERPQAHALLDLLSPAKLGAVRGLLEVMIESAIDANEEMTDEDPKALTASQEYFRKGGKGLTFEEVVSDLGFTMDQVSGVKDRQ